MLETSRMASTVEVVWLYRYQLSHLSSSLTRLSRAAFAEILPSSIPTWLVLTAGLIGGGCSFGTSALSPGGLFVVCGTACGYCLIDIHASRSGISYFTLQTGDEALSAGLATASSTSVGVTWSLNSGDTSWLTGSPCGGDAYSLV